MKVLATDRIRKADDYTIRHEPVASLDLMERAAFGLAGAIEPLVKPSQTVRIFAGYGNNGGDGIALARMLAVRGIHVELHAVVPEREWSPDARANLDRLPENPRLSLSWLKPDLALPAISRDDLVVDALFGSGLSREPEGFMAGLIDHLNASCARIIAVDIPSGLYGEDNRLNSCIHVIRASLTLTFQFPKLAFFLPSNQGYVGDWQVIPIGLHPEFIQNEETAWNYITERDAAGWLRNRSKFDHKGTFGHALLVCGSTGKAGAAVLAASACIRSGSGLTTVAVPSGSNAILQTAVPEAMTIPDPDPACWTTVPPTDPFTAAGAGPGIGMAAATWAALESLFKTFTGTLVLDADALNLLATHPGSLKEIRENTILTPHPGEFRRLFGEDPDDYSRLMRLKELASFYGLVILLKGAHTAVAGPDGSVWFNTTGNPGMATGGSGDVLTGLITGLAAQGYDPYTAARLGVYLHGLAGDLAGAGTGQEALTAGDVIRSISHAYKQLHSIS
jgi:hydroxyethylthiazole kinase-like uncharacterized protein yjeF